MEMKKIFFFDREKTKFMVKKTCEIEERRNNIDVEPKKGRIDRIDKYK